MPRIVDLDKLPPFPKRLPEKLKAIRERLGLSPNDLAPFVGAKTGAEILAYENDEDDLLVSVLYGYAKLAGVPVENLLHDDRDLWFGHRQN
jgi:transcriptional regulator with XRE-family HTH domain